RLDLVGAVMWNVVLAAFVVIPCQLPPSTQPIQKADKEDGRKVGALPPPTAIIAMPQGQPLDLDIGKRQAGAYNQVAIGLSSVHLGHVLLSDIIDRASVSQEKHLKIGIVLLNKNEEKKHDFSGWAQTHRVQATATLKDDLGNTYRLIDFGASNKIVGQVVKEVLYPKKPVYELLVFEAPIDKAK